MAKILDFQNVSLERGERTILHNITWTTHTHENWAILGLNGAGKTTLLKLIHGDMWPTTGRLEVLGGVFGHTSIPELQRKIGWVSTALQDALHVGERVEKIVLSGKFASIGVYEHYTAADMAQAKQYLEQMGGGALIGKRYATLSQGERQTVLIARALMARPQLLILDEPCNGLDLFARERLLQHVAQLAAAPDSPALLFVSHYTEELLPCFQNVLLLRDGQIVRQGTRAALLNQAVLSDFYPAPIQTATLSGERLAVYPQ